MAKQYHQIRNFTGLANRHDARDIGSGLSMAQNIALDAGGRIRTIGGLETHGEVPTHAAILSPGAGLFTYGSDHWRGTTVVDLLADNNATADQRTEANATTGWTNIDSSGTLTSDTPANYGISSNGTTYVMRMHSVSAGKGLEQGFTTVVGRRYLFSSNIYMATDVVNVQVWNSAKDAIIIRTNTVGTGSWVNHSLEFVAIETTTYIKFEFGATSDAYFDDVYMTAIPQPDLDTTWLALADVANAQVDLYNSRDDSFTAGLLDFGTITAYTGVIAELDFPTTDTITNASGVFLSSGIKEGKAYKISGCSTTTANNVLIVVNRVVAGTIYTRGNPFVVTAAEAGTVTLTEYNPTDFHFVDDSLSVSPVGGGIALRPKQYRFVDRIHFSGAGSSEQKYQDWYLNDVGLVAPTDVEATTANGDGTAANLTVGAGFEIGITITEDDGHWIAGTYIIAQSFIYDDGQESELFRPSTDEEFGTVLVDNDSLTLTVRAKGPYDERISGGRIYARLDETDDPWVLLADISMADGARSTLQGQYNSWNESTTVAVAYTGDFKSVIQDVDSYEALTGFSPDARIEKFTSDNRFWDASVIAGNRCFIFGPRYTDAGGKTVHFRDRILYSKIGEYDVFPIDNFIDVTGSDAEDYVAGGVYGSDLLAFKQNTLYIIDISDPLLFQMKQDQQKGKYPYRGISRPAAMFETPHGLAWANRFGLWLYDGSQIVDILGDRVERSKHPLAYQGYYDFDGASDLVTATVGVHGKFTGSFAIEALIESAELTAGAGVITMLDGNDDGWRLIFNAGEVWASLNTIDVKTTSSPVDGSKIHIMAAFDTTTSSGGQIYINGVADGPAVDVSGQTLAITTNDAKIGVSSVMNGHEFVLWNRAPSAAEALARYNGGEIAEADKWGSQTQLVTGFTNNASFLFDTFTTTGPVIDSAISDGDTFSIGYSNGITLTANKNYRLISTATLNSGTAPSILVSSSINGAAPAAPTASHPVNQRMTASDYIEFTPTVTQTYYVVYRSENGESSNTSAITPILVRTGAVAHYPPANLTDAVWTDASSNSLDATVNGATAIFPDTWEHFWTDYSIVGYHGKTNALIVLRDCTGKWSSGQDYGDCWIADLDTLFVTTGRRVFTKGVSYTNFALDWNGDLIIGEQSGTDIITKKWTDKPQSQAAGLINIQTADISFDNPAIIDIISAFTSTYKSSAPQVTPLSYALDGTETWTRVTGNFDSNGSWQKFLADINTATFQCNSIRLRIDNPTNAGTLELNELIIQHEPQVLKLS